MENNNSNVVDMMVQTKQGRSNIFYQTSCYIKPLRTEESLVHLKACLFFFSCTSQSKKNKAVLLHIYYHLLQKAVINFGLVLYQQNITQSQLTVFKDYKHDNCKTLKQDSFNLDTYIVNLYFSLSPKAPLIAKIRTWFCITQLI